MTRVLIFVWFLKVKEEEVAVEDEAASFVREITDFDCAVADMLQRIQDISTKFLLTSSEAEVRLNNVLNHEVVFLL